MGRGVYGYKEMTEDWPLHGSAPADGLSLMLRVIYEIENE
jgi:hypothetical protein